MQSKQNATQREATPEEHMSKLASFYDALGNKAPSTISGYNTAISQYMRFVHNGFTVEEQKNLAKDKLMKKLTDEELENYVEEYFSDSDYYSEFKKFIQANLTDKPPLSALQTFNQIFNFHTMSDVIFTQRQRSILMNQLPTGGVESQESELSHKEIRAVLQHTDTMTSAIILCCATGGLRIGECLNLRCEDINLNTIPASISVRQKTVINGKAKKTKTGEQRYTFISSEAVSAVREWVKIRQAYLNTASKKGQNFKKKKASVSIDDSRLFPVSDQTINESFRDAIIKVYGVNETDSTTNRSVRHLHQLRKFFISNMSLPPVGLDIANFFAGHITPLTKTYFQKGRDQMKEYYLTNESHLLILTPDETRVSESTGKKEHNELKDRQSASQAQLISLMIEKDQLRDKARIQEQEIKALKEQTAHIESLVLLLHKHNPDLFKTIDINSLKSSEGTSE